MLDCISAIDGRLKQGGGENEWHKRAKKELNRFRRKLHKNKIREEVQQRQDREEEEPIPNADDPPSNNVPSTTE
ncbi:hypothetical protein N0V82_006724 [Gnomoniopsis sp. IMI 355080]|nr:hypothetical protein N0V82_006724 [Gnomoniopsis sp. IMI 355080]